MCTCHFPHNDQQAEDRDTSPQKGAAAAHCDILNDTDARGSQLHPTFVVLCRVVLCCFVLCCVGLLHVLSHALLDPTFSKHRRSGLWPIVRSSRALSTVAYISPDTPAGIQYSVCVQQFGPAPLCSHHSVNPTPEITYLAVCSTAPQWRNNVTHDLVHQQGRQHNQGGITCLCCSPLKFAPNHACGCHAREFTVL